jgi:hypothetical protein
MISSHSLSRQVVPHSNPSKRPKPIFIYTDSVLHTFSDLFQNAFAGTNPIRDAKRFGGPDNKHACALSKVLASKGAELMDAKNSKISSVDFMYMQQASPVTVWMCPEDPSVRLNSASDARLMRRGGNVVVSVCARGRIVIAFASTMDGAIRVGVAYCSSDAFNRRNFRHAALHAARGEGAIVMDKAAAHELRAKLRANTTRRPPAS